VSRGIRKATIRRQSGSDRLSQRSRRLIAIAKLVGLPAMFAWSSCWMGTVPARGVGSDQLRPDRYDHRGRHSPAAVLCWHLVKNHPLPEGNKRCAFLATVEFVERNGRTWLPAPGNPELTYASPSEVPL
jgi:hypothetical protein